MPASRDHQANAEILRQLRHYMVRRGRRQYELAADIGAPPQTVNRWFTGDTTVSKAYYNLMLTKGILNGKQWR